MEVKRLCRISFSAWQRTDKLIKGWIISTLTEDVLRRVIGLVTAYDVWQALKKDSVTATLDRLNRLLETTSEGQVIKTS